MRSYRIGLTCLLMLAGGAGAEPENGLPLRRIVLFTSGVGYFQRGGEVTGDARLELRFDAKDVNDLLKSLVLRDLDGGQVASVTYASRDPVTRTLKSFAIDLADRPTLAQILDQVRGEGVEVVAPVPVQGIIVGIERRRVPAGDQVVETEFLDLLTEQGLHAVALDQIQRLRFLRPELEEELRLALAALAQGHNTQKKPVVLRFTGEGKRRVRVAYVTESPVWKTTYRLVLGEGDAPWLQGWAIVENTSDEDWNDVRLTLVSGRPLSFIMDLYEPLYVKRPEVALELYESLGPRKYAGAIEELERELAEEPAADKAKDALARGGAGRRARPAARKALEEKGGIGGGFQAQAGGSAVGELFQYDITAPVSLPRQKSALLPIVSAEVGAEKVSIYNEAVDARHPLNGLRLHNTSTLHLMQGPITVFDEGAYAGDALIDDLPPGDKRLLSYALDLDTEVEPVAKSAPDKLLSVKLAKGTLIATRQLERRRTYNLKNRGTKARKVLVEHPFQADWTLLGPKETERTREVYRFEVPLAPGGSASLDVVEQRTLDQVVALTNLGDDAIAIYLRAPVVDASVKASLEKLVALRHELSGTMTELQAREARVKEIGEDQRRIRENMGRLDRTSQLYQRYTQILTNQEDELLGLTQKIDELRARAAAQRKAIDDFLLSL